LLGGRHIAEAAVLSLVPGSAVGLLVTSVDVLHATSMGGLAPKSRTYRRLALAGLLAASAMVVVDGVTVVRRRHLPDSQ
jgi:hypothetical protein